MAQTDDLYNPEMEAALVAAALIDFAVFAAADIKPTDFHDKQLGALWGIGQELTDLGEYADPVSVLDAAEARGINASGRIAKLQALDDVNCTHWPTYAARVKDLAERRTALDLTKQQLRVLYASNGTWKQDLSDVGTRLMEHVKPQPSVVEADSPATFADMARLIGPTQWEWPDWLPLGYLIELVADSGIGKSALAMRLCGCYLLGWAWPDGTPFTGATGKVLWVETEAGQKLNLDRVQAWGLPMDSILLPLVNPLDDVNLFDAEHLAAIHKVAARDDVRLIIVDSLSGGTGGREKGEDQMPVVKSLAELARNLGKPVILLHHLRKRGLSDTSDVVTLDRVRGSTVIVQPARVVWALDVPNPNMLDHKRLSVIKSNLGRFPKSIGVRIDDGGLAFGEAPQAPKTMTKIDQAKLLLLRLLAGGPRLQTDIEAEAVSEGISIDTLRDAKKKLGCTVSKDGHSGKWSWALPDTNGWQDGEQDGDDA